ncbi:hypothetical protein M427DRAFT_28932 [Gonapodya prolifera JEL478]|uniref:Uncharacterized protein n=1 Tax=Gonapodya prolifera (strain JEL478) TaxID=1344416 RepID=A0A139ARW8_GONPJ|nr:hypothetical protein M427DRAFT_28932 [Gonapodya prolifera JEL478]|eukprot:KXS19480.1 hypothetical protein M427DRAFT_28932 [Gonapodya prolifera JEL478]
MATVALRPTPLNLLDAYRAAPGSPSLPPPSSPSVAGSGTSGSDHGALPLSDIDITASHLIASPYPDIANQLRLDDLTLPLRLFAFALTHLQPTRPDYATAPYLESFNWPTVFRSLRAICARVGFRWERREFYLVVFRSQLKQDCDSDVLGNLDQRSHEEACASGGLLKYWFGSTNAEMRNLATCIWRNRQDAAAGGRGPWHAKARAFARQAYEKIDFQTFWFTVDEGATSWYLEEYAER